MEEEDVRGANEDVQGVDEDVGVVEGPDVVPLEHEEARHERMFQEVLVFRGTA